LSHHVEQHVRQQGRQRTALRRALVPFHHHAGDQYPGVQIATDECAYPSVRDPLRHQAHEDIVIDAIKELL
jgi:hypothetical protein